MSGESEPGSERVDTGLDTGLKRRDIVVAIEFQIIKGSGDAKPAGHIGGFYAGDAGFADDDHVAAAHGAADENDFEFDRGLQIELARAKEKYAGGAYVASDQGDGKIFGAAVHRTEAKG